MERTDAERPLVPIDAVGEQVFLDVLGEVAAVVEAAGIPYVLIGGFASAALGRDRRTRDIDLLVEPQAAGQVIERLAEHGFGAEQTDQTWLFKGYKRGVMVDVIFRAVDDIYLDDEMLARAQQVEFKGQRFMVIPPEDLLIIKARVLREEAPRHWFDGFGILRSAELDWDYLVRRARERPEPLLSLLLYARWLGIEVPDHALEDLWAHVQKRQQADFAERALQPDEYVAARIHEALAQDGHELQVSVKGRKVFVAGSTSTPAQRQAAVSLIEKAAPGYEIEDQMTVTELPEVGEVEKLR